MANLVIFVKQYLLVGKNILLVEKKYMVIITYFSLFI